jgi:hypothetical protein
MPAYMDAFSRADLIPTRHTLYLGIQLAELDALLICHLYGGTLGDEAKKTGMLCAQRACGGHIGCPARHIAIWGLYGTYMTRNNVPMVKRVLQVESPPLN